MAHPTVALGTVTLHQEIIPDHYRIGVRVPEIARHAVAGQFCMIQVSQGLHPFLRRPMSLERIFPDGISFLFKVKGEGTRILSRVTVGQELSIQGPLGNGFTVTNSTSRNIIVAGGMGVAPFPALAEKIIRICSKPPEIILAARNRELVLSSEEFRVMGCPIHIATDDGSAGEKALASDVLRRLSPQPGTRIFACGPMPMLRSVSLVAREKELECQVSLEAQMACGDGACLGCVVESNHEKEGERMVRVCADGPVFDSTIIDWEAHNLAYDR